MILVFNKSSSNDYVGVAYTKHIKNNTTHEPITWLKQGTAGYKLLLNEKNRWGDYSGIAMDPENSYRIWIYGEWAKTSTTWSTWVGKVNTAETKNFNFTNKYQDTNLGGSLTVDNNIVNSGQSIPLEVGANYDGNTNNERFPNWNSGGITYKQNNWDDNSTESYLEYDFEANSDILNHKAVFDKLLYSKIAISAEGLVQPDDGDISFQDPWYVKSDGSQPGDYWITSTNGYYEPNGKYGASEKGVFLDQNPDPSDPNVPHYSVKADQTQTVNINGSNHTLYFQNWSATNATVQYPNNLETAVVFNTANAEVKANHKGIQLSNNPNGFSNSSQRKFVRTDNGYLHKVYESMNKAWYELSTDNGFTWTLANNGQPLSGSNESKLPSIDYRGNEVSIVWQENSGAYSIKMANYYSGNPSFTPRTVHEDLTVSYSYNTNPLIA